MRARQASRGAGSCVPLPALSTQGPPRSACRTPYRRRGSRHSPGCRGEKKLFQKNTRTPEGWSDSGYLQKKRRFPGHPQLLLLLLPGAGGLPSAHIPAQVPGKQPPPLFQACLLELGSWDPRPGDGVWALPAGPNLKSLIVSVHWGGGGLSEGLRPSKGATPGSSGFFRLRGSLPG